MYKLCEKFHQFKVSQFAELILTERSLIMKVKNICMIYLMLIVVLLVGCGNKSSENIGKTQDNNSNEENQRQESEQKHKTEIKQENASNWEIVKATSFYGGVAVITTEDGKKYAIDTQGNKLFDVPFEDENIIFFGDTASVDDYLINRKGEIIASPKQNGYTGLLTEFIEGHALAYYYEEAAPSAIVKIGVLDEDGQWASPLSENHKILLELNAKAEGGGAECIASALNAWIDWAIMDNCNLMQCRFNSFIYAYMGDHVFVVNDIYYDASTDEIKNNYEKSDRLKKMKLQEKYMNVQNTNAINYNNTSYLKYVFSINLQTTEAYGDGYYFKYLQNETGATFYTVLNENGEQMFDPKIIKDSNHSKCICIDREGFVYQDGDNYSYCDVNGNLICQYKNIKKMEPFYDGLAKVQNENDKVSFINKKGEIVIE